MRNTSIYIIQTNGIKREIDFAELNQLRKDILWLYDENFIQINCAFVPTYSFKLNYWEYLTLHSLKSNEQLEFYRIGSLITILCQCVEYVDIAGGNQEVFKKEEICIIKNYVENFEPKDDPEINLKAKVLLGLKISESITDQQLLNSEFEHELNGEFFKNINSIGIDFIGAYYDQKLKENTKHNMR